jgi:hypothetical protein
MYNLHIRQARMSILTTRLGKLPQQTNQETHLVDDIREKNGVKWSCSPEMWGKSRQERFISLEYQWRHWFAHIDMGTVGISTTLMAFFANLI